MHGMSIFIHRSSNEQDGYASHAMHVRQMVIMHHMQLMHVMLPHIIICMRAPIRRGKESIKGQFIWEIPCLSKQKSMVQSWSLLEKGFISMINHCKISRILYFQYKAYSCCILLLFKSYMVPVSRLWSSLSYTLLFNQSLIFVTSVHKPYKIFLKFPLTLLD